MNINTGCNVIFFISIEAAKSYTQGLLVTELRD